ncbi:unnamed protein product [Urochloa decumbens]|uniref:MATH domain-containing protein n=1 Tax=Urochloa decumbens TaxID=240449 RepID=A0ABC8XTM6_9POAL
MSSSVPPPLLTAAGAAPPARSASAVVAKAARGFHVFRVDGYSVTTTLPAGERVTSEPFYVGGRSWLVDYYPNGTDASADSDAGAIAVYLRLQGTHKKERVRAEFKFGLLDPAGTAAYELPARTDIFSSPGDGGVYGVRLDCDAAGDPGCGYAAFITKEDLGRRREILLKEDSLAIRCDVAVAQVEALPVAPKQRHDVRMRRRNDFDSGGGSDSPDEFDGSHEGGGRRGQQPPDDREFIRRCLTAQRRKY